MQKMTTILVILMSAAMFPPRYVHAQEPISPEVTPESKVIFRVRAVNAKSVKLVGGDMPGVGAAANFVKGDNGIWETTVGPVPPGSYRYHFNIDGVPVIDPKNPATSESLGNTWSLASVNGSEFSDIKQVPHGAVAIVNYYSESLKRFRRMHVYTPPGYENGAGKFPVFYLLHGASDSDASWNTVGRAGAILDNLIAAGKAKPMVVVMPAGHTGPFRFGATGAGSLERQMESFENDFTKDIKPYVESHYRIIADPRHRAIAGLSMGGAQTLNIAFAKPEDYGYVGVFSSGIFGIAGGRGNATPSTQWEDGHKAVLDHPDTKKGLRLLWFATGKDDFLIGTTQATVDMLKKHGLEVIYKETGGGHTWLNWRDYLNEFAPKLFQDK